MTDQKRDETKDAGILWDTDDFESEHEVQVWDHQQYDTRFVRYVPHSDLMAAEQTIAEQKARIEELNHEFEFMRGVARKAVKGIGEIVVWREQCNELDKSNHDEPRNFGNVEDTWELLESFASGLEFELTEEIESI